MGPDHRWREPYRRHRGSRRRPSRFVAGHIAPVGLLRVLRPIWALLAAAALGLLVYQAEHFGAQAPRATGPEGPAPQVSLTRPLAPTSTPGSGSPSTWTTSPAQGTPASGTVPMSAPTPAPSMPGSPTPAPTSPPPSPSPSPTQSPNAPAVAVTIAVTPARSTSPLAVRAALVVPTGPPDPPVFPRLTAAVDLLGLRAAIALP